MLIRLSIEYKSKENYDKIFKLTTNAKVEVLSTEDDLLITMSDDENYYLHSIDKKDVVKYSIERMV